jgi:hypothetical protein
MSLSYILASYIQFNGVLVEINTFKICILGGGSPPAYIGHPLTDYACVRHSLVKYVNTTTM